MCLVLLKLDIPGLVDVCGRPPFFWKEGEIGRTVVWMGEREGLVGEEGGKLQSRCKGNK